MLNKYDLVVTIKEELGDNTQDDFGEVDIDDVDWDKIDSDPSNYNIVISNYCCDIDENINYSIDDSGKDYSGSAKMIGDPTDKLKENMIVSINDKNIFRIVGIPKTTIRHTIAQLERL